MKYHREHKKCVLNVHRIRVKTLKLTVNQVLRSVLVAMTLLCLIMSSERQNRNRGVYYLKATQWGRMEVSV